MSDDEFDVDAVRAELGALAERVLPRAFKRLDGRDGPLALPLLQKLAERDTLDEWRADRVAALETILRRGIERLEGSFARTTSRQRAALILFNLAGSPSFPEIEPLLLDFGNGKPYPQIYRRLKEEVGGYAGESTLRRHIKDLRAALARALIESPTTEAQQTSPSSAQVVRSVLADEYVPRPEYEALIRHTRNSGETSLWLWGDAGTGKTRLAKAANRDRLGERSVPILTPTDEKRFQEQMAQLLRQSGVKASDLNPLTVKADFVAQLRKGKLPAVLVFDDMPDENVAAELASSARNCFLIFTSIKRPVSRLISTLEIGSMTVDEAEQMIRTRLPDTDEPDVRRLRVTLAGRPLAIEHSCSFLRETEMAIADYCLALAGHRTAAMQDAQPSRNRKCYSYCEAPGVLAFCLGVVSVSHVLTSR